MKFSIIFVASLLLISNLSSCLSTRTTIISYGYCKTEILKSTILESSPSGYRLTTGYNLNILKKTDTIPIFDGQQFGIEYKIISKKEDIEIITVWEYPEGVKDINGMPLKKTTYPINKSTNVYQYSNFTLGDGYLVPGKWTLKLFDGKKLILQKAFHLVLKENNDE
jgi:hypothetical protein